ncbi:MAG: translation initiation factor IF-2 [Tissierellia bacterium]|nr:translation initiation factor IF-2 [Tissierellia bacterium]
MSKMRVHELAKSLGVSSKELIEFIKGMNIEVGSHMSSLEAKEINTIKQHYSKPSEESQKPKSKTSDKQVDAAVKKDVKDKIDNVKENKQVENKGDKKIDSKGDGRHMQKSRESEQGQKGSSNKPVDNKSKSTGDTRKDQRPVKGANNRGTEDRSSVTTSRDNNKKRNDSKEDNKRYHNANQKGSQNRANDRNRRKPGNNQKNEANSEPKQMPVQKPKVLELSGSIVVKDLAAKMGIQVSKVMTKLMGLGLMVNQNQEVDEDVAIMLASEFDVEVKVVQNMDTIEAWEENLDSEDSPESLKSRPPVVTVMGHVDHGKTSLLDAIKHSKVTASEAGGITQHIGAYTVQVNDKKVTFLDTPGHEAFTAMRSRGAQITDIAILVVAADDGVMPQTIEAISHAKVAKVPIIVAINKIDKPDSNIDRIKQELLENGLMPEDWGGETITVPVSAKSKVGIDDLLEMVLLVAEMQELKANPDRLALGTIIEAQLDKGRGPVATMLVQKGTLKKGDTVVSGTCSGRVRAMYDDKGKQVKKAGPSIPAVIVGLSEVPNAGDTIYATEDEKTARTMAELNRLSQRNIQMQSTKKVSLEDLFEQIKQGEVQDLNIIIKGDVRGSIEALGQSLSKLDHEEVKVNIIHQGVGGITEGDVMLASASNALIIGFNVRPNLNAMAMAKSEGIDIKTYRVIYEAIEDIQAAIKGMLAPSLVEEVIGRCEVRQTFKLPNGNMIAGIYVLNGHIERKAKVKLLRNDIVVHDGDISSLKRFKDDVKEIATGYEGGLGIDRYNDIKEGDILEAYVIREVEREV